MQTYRIEATIAQDSTLVLQSIPFQAGELVEVTISKKFTMASNGNRYPLRGTPVTFIRPTDPVAQTDWEAMK